ncbi:hypothetical protein PROFUN_11282 [Planoprotostelium fungivorum]|uniref:Uncharacterized protein n=1 Tax=Planoprotostelium fungivorum TaxID=1890364 RepID=A0A2P6NAI9_9EUKA|nr:hypothetical protein PROFUN_11282 [Planoprotostelium fungivorum]
MLPQQDQRGSETRRRSLVLFLCILSLLLFRRQSEAEKEQRDHLGSPKVEYISSNFTIGVEELVKLNLFKIESRVRATTFSASDPMSQPFDRSITEPTEVDEGKEKEVVKLNLFGEIRSTEMRPIVKERT